MHNKMDGPAGGTGGEYYDNERQLAGHLPYGNEAQPPAYGIPMNQPGATPSPNVVVISEPSWVWGWCTLITNMVAFFVCPLCGFPGTVMALLSYTDHQNRNYNNARSKKGIAVCCGVTGIGVFAVCMVLFIIMVAQGMNLAPQSAARNYNNGGS